jgi:hypothetical protein
LIILFPALAALAGAQTVPPLVNYQGRLANPDGSPLPTADYELRFRIYDAATNGALVWGPRKTRERPNCGAAVKFRKAHDTCNRKVHRRSSVAFQQLTNGGEECLEVERRSGVGGNLAT